MVLDDGPMFINNFKGYVDRDIGEKGFSVKRSKDVASRDMERLDLGFEVKGIFDIIGVLLTKDLERGKKEFTKVR